LKSGRGKVKPVWGSVQSFDHAVAPLFENWNQDQETDEQTLQPGERHTSKAYRERSMSDIKIPLLANLVSSGMVAVITLTGSLVMRFSDLIRQPLWMRHTQYWVGHRWYLVTPAAFLATMAGLWFQRQLPDLLDDDKLITAVQEHERRSDPAPVEVKPPSVALEFNERNEHGRIEHQVRAVLSAPASNHDGLWRYCEALARGQAFPSLEGGKGGPGAQAFGYTGLELDAWRKEAERAGLLEAPRQKNQPWTITDRGLGAFARIGQQKQKEASYAV